MGYQEIIDRGIHATNYMVFFFDRMEYIAHFDHNTSQSLP